MSINDIGRKIKSFEWSRFTPIISRIKEGLDIKEDIFIVLTIILVGLAGFGLGKLSALEKGREPIQINKISTTTIPSVSLSAAAMIASESAKGLLVASKNGNKYHFPWCAGASQITDKNKIWFNSYDEAKKAGYTAASNCKGLQ